MAICCASSPGSAGSCWAKGTSGPTRPAGQSASKTKTSIKCCFEKFLSVIFKICKSFMFAFLFRAFKEVTVYRGQRAIRSVLSASFTWNELLYRKIGNYCFLFCCIRMYLPHLHFKVQCVTSTVFFLAFFFRVLLEKLGHQVNKEIQECRYFSSSCDDNVQLSTHQTLSTHNHPTHSTPHARTRHHFPECIHLRACAHSVPTQPLSQSSPHHATLNLIDALLLVQGLPGPQGPIGVPGEKVGRMSFHLI